MPVVVVFGEVQAGAGKRRQRAGAGRRQPVQLEARELDDENVEAGGVAHGIEHRNPDVAARRGAQTAFAQHRRCQLRGRGLAVCAGDEHPLGGGLDLVAHAPGQLDIAPQRNARGLNRADQRLIGAEAGRDDRELGAEGEYGIRVTIVVAGELDEIDADDGQDARALGIRRARGDGHAGTQLGQRVGRGKAGDAEAENDDA